MNRNDVSVKLQKIDWFDKCESNKKYFCSWEIFCQNQNRIKSVGKACAFHNVGRDYFKHACIFYVEFDFKGDVPFFESIFTQLMEISLADFFYNFNSDRIVFIFDRKKSFEANPYKANILSYMENELLKYNFSEVSKKNLLKSTATIKSVFHIKNQEDFHLQSFLQDFLNDILVFEKYASMTPFTIFPVRDNVLHITDGTGVFMTLVRGSQKALLVDTGWGVSDIKGLLKKIVRTPVIVVNTHGHPDHCFGNCFFDEVLTPFLDKDVFNEIGDYEDKRKNRFLSDKMKEICKDLKMPPFKGYEAGKVFELGDLSVQAIPLYGHTKGSLGLLIKEERLLLCGDSLGNYVWLFLKESLPLEKVRENCEMLLELPFDKILGSHSKVLWEKASIKTMIKNIDLIRNPDFVCKSEYCQDIMGYKTCLSMVDDENGSSGIVFLVNDE